MNVSSDPCVRGVDPKIECSHCKEVKEKLPNICTYHSSFHLYPILTFFQEGHTNRSCKLRKAQNPHDLTRDDYEFWSCVNVHALPAHDRNENDSDDDDHDDIYIMMKCMCVCYVFAYFAFPHSFHSRRST